MGQLFRPPIGARAWPRHLAMLSLAVALAWLPAAASAQSIGSDAQAKARVVVTFARFVQWPADTFASEDLPLQLCVLHDSATLADAFRRQLAAPVPGRPMQLQLMPAATGHTALAAPAAHCHLMYFDDSAPRRLTELLPPPDEPVLTMAQVDGFASRGGMVELVVVNDALRFDVNLAALQRANLNVRAGVLKLAREVLRDGGRR